MTKLKCEICNKEFKDEGRLKRHKHHHRENYYNPSLERLKKQSELLQEEYKKNPLKCTQCKVAINYKKAIEKRVGMRRNKSDRIFCSHSCSATYNNTHKTRGNNRSKLECYLAKELIKMYPNIEFHFNKKKRNRIRIGYIHPCTKASIRVERNISL